MGSYGFYGAFPQSEGYGGIYEPVKAGLTNDQMREAIFRITTSERFEFGELSHIVLQGTNTIVGYIGDDSLELCCPEEKDSEIYRIPHKHLRRIFKASVN